MREAFEAVKVAATLSSENESETLTSHLARPCLVICWCSFIERGFQLELMASWIAVVCRIDIIHKFSLRQVVVLFSCPCMQIIPFETNATEIAINKVETWFSWQATN